MSEAYLDEILKPLIKTAWLLKLSKSKSAHTATDNSKFGGLPYAEKNESWPCCPTCKNALNFVAQLKHPTENSLHTFFYCFDCFPWGSTKDESGQWLVRSYLAPNMANYAPITPPALPNEYQMAACSCTEHPVQVLPDYYDLRKVSPLADALCEKIDDENSYDIYEAAIIRSGCLDDYATLIGGYPKWIQGETTQSCKICDAEMEFFAQLDSEDEADLMWGDCGVVYLFRCAEHKNEFALELQCY